MQQDYPKWPEAYTPSIADSADGEINQAELDRVLAMPDLPNPSSDHSLNELFWQLAADWDELAAILPVMVVKTAPLVEFVWLRTVATVINDALDAAEVATPVTTEERAELLMKVQQHIDRLSSASGPAMA